MSVQLLEFNDLLDLVLSQIYVYEAGEVGERFMDFLDFVVPEIEFFQIW